MLFIAIVVPATDEINMKIKSSMYVRLKMHYILW